MLFSLKKLCMTTTPTKIQYVKKIADDSGSQTRGRNPFGGRQTSEKGRQISKFRIYGLYGLKWSHFYKVFYFKRGSQDVFIGSTDFYKAIVGVANKNVWEPLDYGKEKMSPFLRRPLKLCSYFFFVSPKKGLLKKTWFFSSSSFFSGGICLMHTNQLFPGKVM